MESRDTSNTSSCLDVHIWNLLVFFPHPTHDLPRCAGGGGTGHGVLGRGPGPCARPGPAQPRRRLARERSGRSLGHRGVLAGGLEEEKGRSPPAAGKKRRVRTAGRGEEEEGELVAGRGEGEEGVLAASHTEKRRGARRRPRGGKGRVCAHDSNEYGGVELGIEGGQI